ncbi:MAG: NrfD/PsrC family molybdoenzyme membrane anchor subunit, partial [Gordonibacter sp.]|uniref:NrfD/PsrC family molybdoenzyme membrane anchor subunit n=1 Tax=Gordonibacter sp. TaxID=1968902 RepID=UPI002FC72593
MMSENISTAESVKAPAALFGGKGVNIGIVVAAVVTLVGVGLWVWQLSAGLVLTNMRNLDSWGLYITSFMFFVGLSAGGLIISSVPRAFGIKGFGGISKIAVWTSICCTILAICFVIIDLGQPLRIWELFAYSNLSSPLMWDIIVLSAYLILSVVYLWATLRFEKGQGKAISLRIISVVALVCAVLVHSVTAWIFGLQAVLEMWNTALLAPWFVSSALVCGVALVLVVVIALCKAGYLKLAQENVIKMMKLLGVFVVVDLYFFGCDLLTEGFPGGDGVEVVAMLTTGPLAPFFWAEIILCAFTALVAFTPKLRSNPLIVVAALAAIVGIFCKRIQLLFGGFQIPNLDYPGVMTPSTAVDWTAG